MDKRIENLQERRKVILAAGGEKKIAKRHEQGKMTARERIEALLDPQSFVEIDAFVEHRCTNFDMATTKAPGEGLGLGLSSALRLLKDGNGHFTVNTTLGKGTRFNLYWDLANEQTEDT